MNISLNCVGQADYNEAILEIKFMISLEQWFLHRNVLKLKLGKMGERRSY